MSTQQQSPKFYVDVQATFRLNTILPASSEADAAERFVKQLNKLLGCEISVTDVYTSPNVSLPGFDDDDDE